MQAQGPAASTRQRTALGDLSNKYNQVKDPVRGNKVRRRAGLCRQTLLHQRFERLRSVCCLQPGDLPVHRVPRGCRESLQAAWLGRAACSTETTRM